ncbi:MAG TPA: pilus assembly protein PilM [Clostridia bacterium]|nr:pilus assembly protein PilM [Clostridia bacterium]
MVIPFSLSELAKKFCKNDILGIDIGSANIKVVHARKKSDSTIKIINYGIGKTPPGCIKNGAISDISDIAKNIKKVLDAKKINEKNVKIAISAGSNLISKVIYVTKVDDKKLEERIREEIRRKIHVNIQTQKIFYRVTGERTINKIYYLKVLVTIVPNTTIENYVRLLKSLDFKLVSIEVPFSSTARFFSKGAGLIGRGQLCELNSGTTAVVDLGSETTNLSILNNGALEFNRIILAGGLNQDEMIGRRLGVSKETAEKYKMMHGIQDEIHLGDEIEKIVNECIRDYLGEILRNVKRSLDFYSDRCGGHKAERIVFIGGGSGIEGLREFAGSIIPADVYIVDMMDFSNIEFGNNMDFKKMRYLVNVLGTVM